MHQPARSSARIALMGGQCDPVTPAEVMAFIGRRIEHGRKAVVANHNLHSLYLAPRDPAMAAFFESADLVQIDSMPLILWGRTLGQPVSRAHRSTYLDWRDQFWGLAAQRGWRVYLLGSKPGVTDRMIERLRRSWPQLAVAGRDGYFDQRPDSAENAAVVEGIRAFGADVVMVGMGMPLQEAWIQRNLGRFDRGVFLSVGGAFDYEAGAQIAAPRWLGMLGLEWLFRFAVQPRRLFSRYFIEPWNLVGPAMDDLRQAFGSERRTAAGPLAR